VEIRIQKINTTPKDHAPGKDWPLPPRTPSQLLKDEDFQAVLNPYDFGTTRSSLSKSRYQS
jgi:hypothetical protein